MNMLLVKKYGHYLIFISLVVFFIGYEGLRVYGDNFGSSWMIICGATFAAIVTAVLAFYNMDTIATKQLEKDNFFAYLELLSTLQEWLRFVQKVRIQIEPALKNESYDRVFYCSKIILNDDFSKIHFTKIQFISKQMSDKYKNKGEDISLYDHFNVGNYSELQYTFKLFINIIELRNHVFDKYIKFAMEKSTTSGRSFSPNNRYLKKHVNYVDFTDYIQLTELMFDLNDKLVKHLEYYTLCLIEYSDKVLDTNIVKELGGLPLAHNIKFEYDISQEYTPLTQGEHKKLRDIYDKKIF